MWPRMSYWPVDIFKCTSTAFLSCTRMDQKEPQRCSLDSFLCEDSKYIHGFLFRSLVAYAYGLSLHK